MIGLIKMKTRFAVIAALLVMVALMCCPIVGATSPRDYEMKYSDPNAPYNVSDSATTGALYIDVLCGHNLFSKDVVIQRVQPVGTVANQFVGWKLIQKAEVKNYVSDGSNSTIDLDGSGRWDGRIVPGLFLLTLTDGNNGDPEYALVQIPLGDLVQVHFIGHGVSKADEPTATNTLTVIDAKYGLVVEVSGTDAVYKIVHHDAVPGTPAWTEHFGDYSLWYGNYHYVGSNNGDYKKVWQWNHYVYQYVAPKYHVAIQYKPAWDEQVLETPGIPASTTGSYIDVTGIVRGLVANGELHIVADYPNLHYNALFTDPCPGYVKTLTVNYQINGVTGTKTVSETEDLNIG
jgi:hypothetical protein